MMGYIFKDILFLVRFHQNHLHSIWLRCKCWHVMFPSSGPCDLMLPSLLLQTWHVAMGIDDLNVKT